MNDERLPLIKYMRVAGFRDDERIEAFLEAFFNRIRIEIERSGSFVFDKDFSLHIREQVLLRPTSETSVEFVPTKRYIFKPRINLYSRLLAKVGKPILASVKGGE